jgi:transcriptional regulator with XRE-family HTH domain
MPPVEHSNQGEEPKEEALSERLRRTVENSDLSFYQIASRLGTSGTMLSMWLAGTARPRTAEELAKIEKVLTH